MCSTYKSVNKLAFCSFDARDNLMQWLNASYVFDALNGQMLSYVFRRLVKHLYLQEKPKSGLNQIKKERIVENEGA